MRNAHLHAAAARIRSLARLERQLAVGQRVSELAYSEMLHEEYSGERRGFAISASQPLPPLDLMAPSCITARPALTSNCAMESSF